MDNVCDMPCIRKRVILVIQEKSVRCKRQLQIYKRCKAMRLNIVSDVFMTDLSMHSA